MVDVLVFSHSCLRRVNRLVYEKIAENFGLEIVIVLPHYLLSGSKKILADKMYSSDRVEIVTTDLNGNTPRNFTFSNGYSLLRKIKPNLVLIDYDPISFMAVQMAILQLFFDFKLIALTCENQPLSLKDNYKRKGVRGLVLTVAKRTILSFTARKIIHLFTINNLGFKIYSSLGFKSVSKIPLGFSPEVFKEDLNSRVELRNKYSIGDKIVFAYVGRIVKEKGIHILLSSLSEVMELDNWVLLLDEFVDAQNSYISEIYNLIKNLNLESRIIFFNAPHADIYKFMNAADVIVIPSISTRDWIEQYGRVAPEAMACGKLVIASDTGALPELIENAGIIVQENNKRELSNIIRKILLRDISIEKYRTAAINRSASLSVNEQAKQMYLIFKKYLSEK
jgi:glycosyltransferase involved in cell wall biosynthesis